MVNSKSVREKLEEIIPEIKKLAIEYYKITGKPIGITGEIGEYEAARLLGLELQDARTAGYDAIRKLRGKVERIQIKSRRVTDSSKLSQRIGSIKIDNDWEKVILVLLDEEFEPYEIYEAGRVDVVQALTKPGSKARNERGALSVSKFKAISKLVWKKEIKNKGDTVKNYKQY